MDVIQKTGADVRQRFSLDRHIDAYLEWYNEILEDWKESKTGGALQTH